MNNGYQRLHTLTNVVYVNEGVKDYTHLVYVDECVEYYTHVVYVNEYVDATHL